MTLSWLNWRREMGLGGQYTGQANKGINEVWGQVDQEVDETRAFRRERMEVLGKRMGKGA